MNFTGLEPIERHPDRALGTGLPPRPVSIAIARLAPRIGAATWRVTDGVVTYERLRDVSSAQRDAVARGDRDLLARAIKRADENDQVYDLTIRFVEEYVDHPYGRYDDLLDAVSRVYDMQVTAPRRRGRSTRRASTGTARRVSVATAKTRLRIAVLRGIADCRRRDNERRLSEAMPGRIGGAACRRRRR
jgi:hypothetical protein